MLSSMKSQRIDYFYNFEHRPYKNDSLIIKEVFVLQMSDEKNIFLSKKFIEADSINKLNKFSRMYVTPQFNDIITYNTKDRTFDILKKFSMFFYQYERNVEIDWKLHNQTKKVDGYFLQKATTNFGGRNWEAWFCKDVSQSFGPYLFYGLPGLIFEIYDDNNIFHYSLVKSLKNKQLINVKDIIDDKIIQLTNEEMKKVEIDYKNDPLTEYKSSGSIIYNEYGLPYTAEDYRNLGKKIQDKIKKKVPIEIEE